MFVCVQTWLRQFAVVSLQGVEELLLGIQACGLYPSVVSGPTCYIVQDSFNLTFSNEHGMINVA